MMRRDFIITVTPQGITFSGGALIARDGPLTALFSGRFYGVADGAAAALAAFRRSGTAGLLSLTGSYAAAIIDETHRTVHAATDSMNTRSLFWRAGREKLSIATRLADVMRPEDGVDPGYLADVLLMPASSPAVLAETPYAAIRRVRAGECLTASPDRQVIAARFDWLAAIAAHRFTNEADAAAAIRHTLGRAVEARLSAAPAAHLSGGMDSTAVALLAAEHQPVTGLALTFEGLPPLDGERAFIDAVTHPALTLQSIPAAHLLDFGAFSDVKPHAEPLPWLFRLGLDHALLESAHAAGVDTILTGEGGDLALALPPYEIAEFLRRGRFHMARKRAAAFAEAAHTGLWTFLKPYGVEPLFRTAGKRFAAPPWVNTQGLDWPDRARHHAKALYGANRPVPLGAILANARNSAGAWIADELSRPIGIEIENPFLDPDVIAVTAAARLQFPPRPGVQKPLLAAAMRGLVPDRILDRRGKQGFNALYYRGLARHRDALLALADNPPAPADQLFDAARLKEAIRTAALGTEPLESLHGLAASLAIIRWLRLLPHWKRQTAAPEMG